jgi:hypothetical protein
MRAWSCFVLVSALAGCTGETIDAGSNDAGEGHGEGGGANVPDGGAVVIASEIQLLPSNLASDGTTLFWVTSQGSGGPLSSVPVTGGPIKTVVPAAGGGFLAVDDVNVYYTANLGIYRAPKGGGGMQTFVTAPGGDGDIGSPAVFGNDAYWLETSGGGGGGNVGTTVRVMSAPLQAVMSSPLQGGPISTVATWTGTSLGPQELAVTATTIFVSGLDPFLASFPLATGVPDGGMPVALSGFSPQCEEMISDADAIYCLTVGHTLARVANDGTTTQLGSALGATTGNVALDDTYVYWVDATTVGTIMRAPKLGGAAVILARDTSPNAIAVDANAVYWDDAAGNIWRLAK